MIRFTLSSWLLYYEVHYAQDQEFPVGNIVFPVALLDASGSVHDLRNVIEKAR
jgi:hypothetical protein